MSYAPGANRKVLLRKSHASVIFFLVLPTCNVFLYERYCYVPVGSLKTY